MTQAKILIIEDELVIARDLETSLQNMGYSVSSIAASGEEAIERVKDESPDLVLMDIVLQGKIDGIEAADQIRLWFNTPVVYLTAYADSNTLQRAKITEPYGYILKPFEERELHTIIEIALYKHKIESKLKKSEQKWHSLYESLPGGSFVINDNGIIEDVNEVFCDMTGFSKFELIDQHCSIVCPKSPDKCSLFDSGKKGIDNEDAAIKTKDGWLIPIIKSARRIPLDDREVIIENFQDITERKWAEKIQSVLYHIAKATNESENLNELLKIIHRELKTLIDAPNFYVALYDREKELYSFPYWVDEYITDFTPQPLHKSLTDYVRRHGEPLLVDQKYHQQLIRAGEVEMVNPPSRIWLGVPLKTKQEITGVIVIKNYRENLLRQSPDVELMTFISDNIALAIERKRMEEQLRESEKKMRLVVQNLPVMVDALDENLNICMWNQECERVTGYSAGEIISNPKVFELFYPDKAYREKLWTILANTGGYFRNLEMKMVSKDGTEKIIAWSNVSKYYPIPGWKTWAIGVDITGYKRADEQLERYTTALEQSKQELQQFAKVLSHDLHEPLRMVSNHVQLLVQRYKGKLDREADDFIVSAANGINRIQNLIHDLLLYSRIETNVKNFAPTDSGVVLERIIADLQPVIKASEAVLTRDPLPTVTADETQLGQLFRNLIGNAIKFRSQEPALIHISVEKKPNEWLFSVSDNGIGIAPENSDNIFKIFSRLHAGSKYTGTGIGLAICKKIVERHGGRIWVESKLNQGSIFYFTIVL